MKTLVICEGCSSAVLYVEEARARGLDIIIVNPPRLSKGIESYCEAFKKAVGGGIKIIDMNSEDEYPSLIENLKKEDIIAVVPGSDYGTEYSDRISHDLGFKGNDPKTTYLRCTKYGMYEALGKAGVRRIETSIVKSEKDIDKFWDDNKIEVAFMKQNQGTSSFGNRVCETKEEAKEHFHKLQKTANPWGHTVDVLIQEYISGTEYIVNTVTHNGKHCVTDIWKYNKYKMDSGEIVYNTTLLLMDTDPNIGKITEYIDKVLDAVDMKYGPCHSEIMIDKKGPVLIETNPRPMGGNMKSAYLDECLGQHIADVGLDSFIDGPLADYVDEGKFRRPKNMGGMIDIIVPHDLDTDLSILDTIARVLKTYRGCDPAIVPGMRHYSKTIDLDISPCCIKVCGSEKDVMRDLKLLETIEFDYPDIIFTDKTMKKSEKIYDFEFEGVVVSEGYTTLNEMFKDVIEKVSKMSKNEKIFILPNVYENAPYGRKCAEILLQVADVMLGAPLKDCKDVVWGTKTT